MSNSKLRKLRKEAARPVYKFAGDRGYGVPAQVAGEALERIAATHGHITPALVVDDARPDAAPLHPVFEWDDGVAGEKFRRHQASTLVRAVVVVPPPEEQKPEHKSYVLTTVQAEPRPVYVEATAVVNDAAMFADAVARLERKLQEARRSVDDLRALAENASATPERMAALALAMKALEMAGKAVADLH